VIVYDIGQALNPAFVEGQIHGGAARGIGGVFLEEFAYDEAGKPLATSFMDGLPASERFRDPAQQRVEVLEEHPSPLNPLGIKGAGEVGPAGTGAAFANAVADALGEADDAVDRLPLTASRVLAWLAGSASPSHPDSLEVPDR
jgi:carbon-monoxide dehydrogenase large subunit